MNALSNQVGGDHYSSMPYQPIVFSSKLNLPFIAGSIVKYVCRWRKKNGAEDLAKAVHMCDIAMELAQPSRLNVPVAKVITEARALAREDGLTDDEHDAILAAVTGRYPRCKDLLNKMISQDEK